MHKFELFKYFFYNKPKFICGTMFVLIIYMYSENQRIIKSKEILIKENFMYQ